MIVDTYLIIATLIAFIAGVLLSWIVMRLRSQFIIELEKSKLESETLLAKERLKEKEYEISQNRNERESFEQKILALEKQNKDLEKKVMLFEQNETQIRKLEEEIEKQLLKSEEINSQNVVYQKTIAELKTRNEDERKNSDEKVKLLTSAKEELKAQFKALANEIFEEKGKLFSEQNKEKLDVILNPFNTQLKEFKKKVDDVYINETKERASLKLELQNLTSLNQKLNQEAINLTRALKGDKKKQGNWGELILDRVYERGMNMRSRKDLEIRKTSCLNLM
jgi:DNA recombination protein RmuC